MNFLAHYAVLRDEAPSPLGVLGNALPDLLPLADSRARFRASRLADAPPGDLKDGVLLHLATDAAFHRSAAFAEAQENIKTLFRAAPFDAPPPRVFFLAHILAELALDAVLLRADPTLAASFYEAFTAADFAAACRWTEDALGRALPSLPGVLAQFAASRYLDSYVTDAGVAEGISRLCVRARLPAFTGADFARLTEVVSQAVAQVDILGPQMMTKTQKSLVSFRQSRSSA